MHRGKLGPLAGTPWWLGWGLEGGPQDPGRETPSPQPQDTLALPQPQGRWCEKTPHPQGRLGRPRRPLGRKSAVGGGEGTGLSPVGLTHASLLKKTNSYFQETLTLEICVFPNAHLLLPPHPTPLHPQELLLLKPVFSGGCTSRRGQQGRGGTGAPSKHCLSSSADKY